ncbi:MAG: acyltransferase [Lachnospiraceae bacterium]|nr:acyltransferase [Lachnospiraceae bacterium]
MNKRLSGLDLYRIIGCAFVIINHCNSKVLAQVTPKSLAWYVTVGVIFITKITVPGFFMITGYNLLHRSDDYRVYVKRIVRIAVVLAVMSLFYHVWHILSHTYPTGLPEGATVLQKAGAYIAGYIQVLWRDGATDAFWYLYTYLGLMIMMPAMQRVAAMFSGADASSPAMSRRTLIAVLAVASVYVSVIPSVTILCPEAALNPNFKLPMIGCAVMYLFIGHACYLYRDELRAGGGLKISDLWLIGVFLAAFAGNMVLAGAEFRLSGGNSFVSFTEIETLLMVVESVAVYCFLIKLKADGGLGRVIGFLAPATFGIYLFADFVCTGTHMIYWNMCRFMNRLFAVAIQDIVAFAVALCIVLVLRLIPEVRKWI